MNPSDMVRRFGRHDAPPTRQPVTTSSDELITLPNFNPQKEMELATSSDAGLIAEIEARLRDFPKARETYTGELLLRAKAALEKAQ
tara:strand:+ start:27619 stop:27876 length:258 start_codon:yes stop_codon:yes gene_type:complete